MMCVVIKKRKYYAPTGWNEMEARHLRIFCKVILQNLPQGIALQKICRQWCKVPRRRFLKTLRIYRAERIEPAMQWLFDNALTHNSFPTICIREWFKRHTYYDAGAGMNSLTGLQFASADLYYVQYCSLADDDSKQWDVLAKLASCLYLRDFENFADIDHVKRQRLFKRLPYWRLLAIKIYYEGWRKDIVMRYPELFDGGEDNTAPGEQTQPMGSWLDVWVRMAGGVPTEIDNIERWPIHKTMVVLIRIIRDKAKQQTQQPAQ